MTGIQSINILDRKRLETNGVKDVKSFNESELVLLIGDSTVYIGGYDLKVEKFSVDSGELVLLGTISSLYFSDNTDPAERRGFLSRVFG
ncbi:MAG: hypothetical protein E7665_05600 [Ruminococcaceae bacterium]|nr:hypothetical protein [Oscillospiraceae bacterium]